MALFIISFLLVFGASYFIAISFEQKSFLKFFIYLLLTAFANVVLTFEILSLFSAISVPGIFVLNLLLAGAGAGLWLKRDKPLPEFHVKPFIKTIWHSLLLDKYLLVLGCAFCLCAVFLYG